MSEMMDRKLLLVAAAVSVLSACGGAPPPPKVEEAPKAESAPKPHGPSMQLSQELGSIDPRAVDRTLQSLDAKFERCHSEGRKRIEYLSGDIKVFLRIDTSGHVKYGYFEESSLGDNETEHCIMDVFTQAAWPKPEGGEAEVRHGFGWSAGGERAPTPWDPDKVTTAVDDSKDAKKSISKCKSGVRGTFRVTAYVEPDGPKHGKFQAIGVVPPNKEAADKIECVVDALRPVKLPSPGSYAAKVTFPL